MQLINALIALVQDKRAIVLGFKSLLALLMPKSQNQLNE